MTVIDDFLTPNSYSRPQTLIKQVMAVVIHWTGNPNVSAKANRDFFESRKNGTLGYGSAHFIVDESQIIRCIPTSERAFHVGSSQIDPASGKIYTDFAREKFGDYASNPQTMSPNTVTIGIEMVPIDGEGRMNDNTVLSTIELAAVLCKQYNLDPMENICTHHDIVGWKDCHRWYVNHPEDFDILKKDIQNKIQTI